MNQSSDSDDMIIHNGSDDDDDKAGGLSETPTSNLYWNQFFPKVVEVITADDSNETEMRHSHGSVSKPLGRERLSAVELAQVIIGLPKGDAELEMLVGQSDNILMKLL